MQVTAPPPFCLTGTIGEAKRMYAEKGKDYVYPAFRDVIKKLIFSGYRDSITIRNYTDALFIHELIFNHTQHRLLMLSGPDGDGFLSTLQQPFEAMLERLRERDGKAQIILLRPDGFSGGVQPGLTQLQREYEGTLEVATGVAISPMEHFSVADGRMMRLEEVHEPLDDEMPADSVRAEVFFNAPDRAGLYEEKFKNIWKMLHP